MQIANCEFVSAFDIRISDFLALTRAATKRSPAKPRRRWRHVAGVAAVVVIVVLAIAIGAAYRATKHVPQFYEQALQADPTVQRTAGDELERRALDLRNEAQRGGAWEAIFTEEQINGWLAVDLIEKFPELLPEHVESPRMRITPEEVQLACRYQSEQVDTVVSLALTVTLTEEPNVVAVRIKRARAGALPIPLNQFLEQITAAAHGSDLDVRWLQEDGDPVALLRLPQEHTDLPDRKLHLERFELREGEAFLSGRTEWLKSVTPR
jgi:hypothetical protein